MAIVKIVHRANRWFADDYTTRLPVTELSRNRQKRNKLFDEIKILTLQLAN